MREQLIDVLITYLPLINTPTLSNPLVQRLEKITPHIIAKEASISNAYAVDASAGQGNWAEIPWIGIFDKGITTSAQRGYYIVYLFRADMQGVYLSLNQGWKQFEDHYKPKKMARAKIQESAAMLRQSLRYYDGFELEKIDLAARGDLGLGYELGHICGKYYKGPSLPNDLILVDDLRNLIGVYHELKGKLSGKPLIEELEDGSYEKENLYLAEGEKPTQQDYEKVKTLSQEANAPEDIDALLKKLENMMAGKEPKYKQRLANALVRNRKINDLIKQRAGYMCQICKAPGFEKRNGGLYAEAHHVEELGGGGKDLPSNMICVCPLCHRKLHYGKSAS